MSMNWSRCFFISAIAAVGSSTSHTILPDKVCDTTTSSIKTFADVTTWEKAYTEASCKTTATETAVIGDSDAEVCFSSDMKAMAINMDFTDSAFNLINLKLNADKACGHADLAGYDATQSCTDFTVPDSAHQIEGTELAKNLVEAAKNTYDIAKQPIPLKGAKSIIVTVTDCALTKDKHSITLKLGSGALPTKTPDSDVTTPSGGDDTTTTKHSGIGSAIASATVLSAAMAYLSL